MKMAEYSIPIQYIVTWLPYPYNQGLTAADSWNANAFTDSHSRVPSGQFLNLLAPPELPGKMDHYF